MCTHSWELCTLPKLSKTSVSHFLIIEKAWHTARHTWDLHDLPCSQRLEAAADWTCDMAWYAFFWNWPQQATGIWVYLSIIVCCIQICTKLIEPIGTNSRIRYIKFGVNIKKYKYWYKFEIKYCGKTVLTDPFNYIIVEAHDLVRQDSVLRRAR